MLYIVHIPLILYGLRPYIANTIHIFHYKEEGGGKYTVRNVKDATETGLIVIIISAAYYFLMYIIYILYLINI